jgi:hypothetical protein
MSENTPKFVRIKKGVKPYGGRRVQVWDEVFNPDGTLKYVNVSVGTIPSGFITYIPDLRTYYAHEIEEIKP